MALWLTVSALVAALGGALLVLGWRGRRIGEVPRCRGCEFDLTGLGENVSSCPECGRSITTARGVVIGTRRKLGWMMAVGAFVLVAGLLVGTGAVLSGQAQLAAYMPYWMLERLVQSGGAKMSDEALAELHDRLVKGELSASQQNALIGLALDVHGDKVPGVVWRREWSELIAEALAMGLLSWEQEGRYYKQSIVFTPSVRKKVPGGRKMYIRLEFPATRFAPVPTGSTRPRLTIPNLLFDFTTLEEPANLPNQHPRASIGTVLHESPGLSTSAGVDVPVELIGGAAMLHIRCTALVQGIGAPDLAWFEGFNLNEDPPPGWWRVTRDLAIEIEVLPKESPVADIININSDASAIAALPAEHNTVRLRREDPDQILVFVSAFHPTEQLLFGVFVRESAEDGRGIEVGYVSARGGWHSNGDGAFDTQLFSEHAGIDIILRPSIESAIKHPHIESLLGVEIIFEDVPLSGLTGDWSDPIKPARIERYEPFEDL